MPTTAPIPCNKIDEISLTSHPPERDRRFRRQPAQAGGCCCSCCCCCCLHSIGGIVGALVGASFFTRKKKPHWEENVPGHPPRETWVSLDESEDLQSQDGYAYSPKKKSPSAVAIFWWTVLILFILSGIFSLGGIAVDGWFGAILIFPAIELVAVLIALGIVGAVAGPDMRTHLRELGGIALGIFLGAGIGILIMLPLFNN
jgi:hypothetical protein